MDMDPWAAQLGSPLDFEIFAPGLSGWNNEQLDLAESDHQTRPWNSGLSAGLTVGAQTRFQFLGRLTSCSGLNTIFNFVATTELSSNFWDVNTSAESMVWDLSLSFDNSAPPDEEATNSNLIEVSRMMTWISHPLFPCSKAVWDTVEKAQQSKNYFPAANSARVASDKAHIEFFNPINIEKFLDLYWNKFSFHCPIIHRPTFEPTKAPSMMVLVLVLIGAHMSDCLEDSLNAKPWLDMAEDEIFAHPSLSGETQGSAADKDSEKSLRERLEVLQSAIYISVLQTWEGSNVARTRICSNLYSKVVSVGSSFRVFRTELFHNWILGCEKFRLCTWKAHK